MAKNKKTKKISDYQRIMFGMVALVALVAMIGMMSYTKDPSSASGKEQGFLVQEVDLQNNVISEWYEYEDYMTKSLSGVAAKVPAYCKDTDGGWNYYVKGTVTQQRRDRRVKIKVDKCRSSELLIEWACSGSAIRKKTYDCSKEGKECSDGACISSIPQPVCGNRIVEPGEECDGDYRACTDANGNPGMQNCTPQCIWGPCFNLGYCGDGVVNQPYEECDGNDLNGVTCTDLNFSGGVLSCLNDCTFDLTGCTIATSCIEKDNGKDFYNKGSTSVGYMIKTDWCHKRSSITEYYCGDNGLIKDDEYFLLERGGEEIIVQYYHYNSLDKTVTFRELLEGSPAGTFVNSVGADGMVEFIIRGEITLFKVMDMTASKPDLKPSIPTILWATDHCYKDYDCVDGACTFPDCRLIAYLKEGETGTYHMLGLDYEVTAVAVKDMAQLSVNGMLTKPLSIGESDVLGGDVTMMLLQIDDENLDDFGVDFCFMKFPSDDYIIKQDIGNFHYSRTSDEVGGECNFLESTYAYDPCDSFRAFYTYPTSPGLYQAYLDLEIYPSQFTQDEFKQEICDGVDCVNLDLSAYERTIAGNNYYKIGGGSGLTTFSDVTLSWISNNNIIEVKSVDWSEEMTGSDVFNELLSAYFDKYPSDLEFEQCVCIGSESRDCTTATGPGIQTCTNCQWGPCTPLSTCTDSDGGLNYYVSGGVWGYNGSYYYNMTDTCLRNTTLFEYYCDNGPAGTQFYCPNGCFERRCLY